MISIIKILKDIDEYIDFINKINSADNYSDSMLSNEVQRKNNLLESVNKKIILLLKYLIIIITLLDFL